MPHGEEQHPNTYEKREITTCTAWEVAVRSPPVRPPYEPPLRSHEGPPLESARVETTRTRARTQTKTLFFQERPVRLKRLRAPPPARAPPVARASGLEQNTYSLAPPRPRPLPQTAPIRPTGNTTCDWTAMARPGTEATTTTPPSRARHRAAEDRHCRTEGNASVNAWRGHAELQVLGPRKGPRGQPAGASWPAHPHSTRPPTS